MERVSSSETLVYAYHTIQHNIPEDNKLQIHPPPRKPQIPKHALTSILQEPSLQYV